MDKNKSTLNMASPMNDAHPCLASKYSIILRPNSTFLTCWSTEVNPITTHNSNSSSDAVSGLTTKQAADPWSLVKNSPTLCRPRNISVKNCTLRRDHTSDERNMDKDHWLQQICEIELSNSKVEHTVQSGIKKICLDLNIYLNDDHY